MSRILKVLVACEESQAVTKEFRRLGHEAFSCDILPCSGGHPEWHLQMDCFEAIKLKDWDVLIGFPPCTDIASSGARHFKIKIADGRQQKAKEFFLKLYDSKIPFIALENPVGVMSTYLRKPDQIIHPYHFGDPEAKRTCIWVKGLPILQHTNVVEPEYVIYNSKKNKSGKTRYGKITGSNPSTNNKGNAMLRSKTYPGIARAMAEQWSEFILTTKP